MKMKKATMTVKIHLLIKKKKVKFLVILLKQNDIIMFNKLFILKNKKK